MSDDNKKRFDNELFNARKLEAIGVLAGGIAHDFNNLLFVIMGNINMAQLMVGGNHQSQKYLVEAEKACRRAKDLTQKFITFSSGGEPVKRRISVRDLVSNVAGLVLSGSAANGEIMVPEQLWDVEADENQMRQVFTSLLENAREAMCKGGVILIGAQNVEISETDSPEGPGSSMTRYVKVEISDQGIGIAEENIPNIFDPYFSTKYRGSRKGMGFGLAIAHSVIKKHDGSIKVESTSGKGTTISVLIPAAVQDSAAPALNRFNAPSRTKRILIMEDEELQLDLIKTMLEHLGYEVDTAIEGQEAIDVYSEALAEGRHFDAVILDLTVKFGMDGREAIRKIHYLNPNVRAIVSSGHSADGILSDYTDWGFCDILKKPYNIEDLRAALDRVLGR